MLSAGEISKGMKITVISWKPREIPKLFDYFEENDSWKTTSVKTFQDKSYCGDVLEVLAVDLPYVVVKDLKSKDNYTAKLDTRECQLKELKQEYVDALLKR